MPFLDYSESLFVLEILFRHIYHCLTKLLLKHLTRKQDGFNNNTEPNRSRKAEAALTSFKRMNPHFYRMDWLLPIWWIVLIYVESQKHPRCNRIFKSGEMRESWNASRILWNSLSQNQQNHSQRAVDLCCNAYYIYDTAESGKCFILSR